MAQTTGPSASEPGETLEAREARLLAIWRDLVKLFAGWSYGMSHPADWLPQTARPYSDVITDSLKMRYWRKLSAVVAPVSDRELDFLRTLAQQRFEYTAAVLRISAVFSVTFPGTFLVLANQFFPEWVIRQLQEDRLALTIIALILLINLSFLFAAAYKARELRMALEIEANRRRLRAGRTVGDALDDVDETDFPTPI